MKTLIGIRTALLLYALLVAASVVILKGTALALALIIVLALALKSYLHHLRSRFDE